MSPKNLNVSSKTHRYLLDKLKDKRTFKIYKEFENKLNLKENFIVGVSGGSDSLALSFLSKIYSIKHSLKVEYFIIDHKLRIDSSSEAKNIKNLLKKFSINLKILVWNGTKPKKNIQSIAREKRYMLLTNKAKNLKTRYILTGHHLDDLYENFFIRILRGSGLMGLVSLDKETQIKKINLLRPLINFEKKKLKYLTNFVFGYNVEDPSNQDEKYKRVRIRKFIQNLQLDGLDRQKFFLTIKNLKSSNETIKFYITKNIKENTFFSENKNSIILKNEFFEQSNEVVLRSFMEVIKFVGKKYYSVRGKKLEMTINAIKNTYKPIFKLTLGKCVIKKVNNSVIVLKEQ